MEVKAIGKYISISPKKAREIADLVRGKKAAEARDLVRFMPQVSAREIGKVLKSAMANAETNFNLDKDALTMVDQP
jgi:large subunit ribosomal protein L22